MNTKYKCTYFEVNDNENSKNFGFLVKRSKSFLFFNDAVDFARKVANTNVSAVHARPVIEEVTK